MSTDKQTIKFSCFSCIKNPLLFLNEKTKIGFRGYVFLLLWSALLIAIFLAIGITAVARQADFKAASISNHLERINPNAATLEAPPNAVQVTSGIYLDRIITLSIRDYTWTADVYIWFTWDENSRFDFTDPMETFHVIDGNFDKSPEVVKSLVTGTRSYRLYRATITTTKFFDVSRFPCDDHLLTIGFEAKEYTRDEMVFKADMANTSISSRVTVANYGIYNNKILEVGHGYKTSRGEPMFNSSVLYSQIRFGIWIKRTDLGSYLKMFIALFLSVIIALLAFFLRPDDSSRFSLGIGALFAAVANQYFSSTLLPETSTFTLTDTINLFGVFTIFVSLFQSSISLYLHVYKKSSGNDSEKLHFFIFDVLDAENLAHVFDLISFCIISVAYTIINCVLPASALL